MRPYIQKIEIIAKELLKYDPNYNYGPEEEEADEMEVDSSQFEDEDEAQSDYSDDDDLSWKVRRSAAKCIEALVSQIFDPKRPFFNFEDCLSSGSVGKQL